MRRTGETARIEIWDTGRGIAKEDQQSIFQEFKRIDGSSTSATGLGLAIVERACNRLDHGLHICSELGRGSRFSVELPVWDDVDAPLAKPHEGTKDKVLDQEGLIVFLVENDLQLADALTMLIESWVGQVIHTRNGTEALELLSDIDLIPDALLLDFELGNDMDGATLFYSITEKYGPIPASLLSAHRSVAIMEKCEEISLPTNAKPIDRGEMRRFLNNAAQQSR
ncbi:MAG: ATP-binding protein [Pikeienuella sp.]